MKLFHAIRLLTIIPLPGGHEEDLVHVARSAAYFPFVGFLIGAILFGLKFAAGLVWTDTTVTVLLVTAWIFLTGGLHLDGLADTADGLLGGWTREKRLSIMKDSRIGAFGALALLTLVLLKIAFLGELTAPSATRVIFLTPAIGRWIMVMVMLGFPSARPDGMGALYKNHMRRFDGLLAVFVTLVGSFLLLSYWGLILCAIVSLLVLVPAFIIHKALGGLTGDTYGALCEIGELVTLVVAGLMSLAGAHLSSAIDLF